MAKKRKTALPRVTVLAYSRRDLLAFAESVEALRHLVEDLRAEVAALKGRKKPAAVKPAAAVPTTNPPVL